MPTLIDQDTLTGKEAGLDGALVLDHSAVMQWKNEAPLRLVAAALVDSNNRETVKNLRERLTSEIIDPKEWNRWWRRVQPALKESPRFRYPSARNGKIRLIGRVADVPRVGWSDLASPTRSGSRSKSQTRRLTPAARLAEWVMWIQADVASDIPESAPQADLLPILRTLPTAATPVAIARLTAGIEERVLASGRRRATTANRSWITALVTILHRWSEVPDAPNVSLIQITDLATRILDVPGLDEEERLAAWFADYISMNGGNVSIVADALQLASQKTPSGADRLLTSLRHLLDVPSIVSLWQTLLLVSLSPNSRPTSERWLSLLEIEEKAEVLSSLLFIVRGEALVSEVGALIQHEWVLTADKRQGDLFMPIVLSWLLHDQLRSRFTRLVQGSATSLHNSDYVPEGSLVGDWKTMIQSVAREEVGRLRTERNLQLAEKDLQLDEVRHKLKEAEASLDRAGRQIKHLQAELRKAGHIVSLNISRDALMILGGAAQRIAILPGLPSPELRDVSAKITLALVTLGAELFGEVGGVVPYEPDLHETNDCPVIGGSVRIIAPGLRYMRDVDTPLVLIRMQVRLEK